MPKGFIAVKSSKVFKGKKYELVSSHSRKDVLVKERPHWQSLGYHVRIVKRMSPEARRHPNDPYSRSGIMYCLYVRSK